jgi:hypothetical protein
MKIVSIVYFSGLLLGAIILSSCSAQRDIGKGSPLTDTIRIEGTGGGLAMQISFVRGVKHNHPTFAIWMEDMEQHYLRSLFVTKSIGTGIFGHGPIGQEVWDSKPGVQQRPAALPYWLHKRSQALNVPLLPDPEHPVLDGYTGATPQGDFVIKAVGQSVSRKFRLVMEVNQPWDWNEYWTNGLYDDADYRTSCQPSLVYAVVIDLDKPEAEYYLNPIGHGHHAGKDGALYTDLRTMTTALNIIDHVCVTLVNLK